MHRSAHSVQPVVERARRRLLWQYALREAFTASAIFLAGVLIVLVFGTDLLSPELMWAFAGAGAAVGFHRWMAARPPGYRVAQRLDACWKTADQISTAYYFETHPARSAWAARQREEARRAAAQQKLPAALPLRLPRTFWPWAAALAASVMVVGVRYATQPRLSFEPPVVSWTPGAGEAPGQPESAAPPAPPQTEDQQRRPSRPQQGGAPREQVRVEGLDPAEPYGDELASPPAASEAAPGEGQEASAGRELARGRERSAGSETPPPGEPRDSLMDRLREAFEDLLASLGMEPETEGGGAREAASAQADSQQPEGPEEADGGTQQAAGEGRSAPSAANAPEGKTPMAQFVEGGSSGDASQQDGPSQATSTAGSNEGSKEIQDAVRREAMGELAEIYNRRAEQIRGEVTVETGAADQRAQTPHSPVETGHQDGGAAVARDEIPAPYQEYVKRYFHNLRQAQETR